MVNFTAGIFEKLTGTCVKLISPIIVDASKLNAPLRLPVEYEQENETWLQSLDPLKLDADMPKEPDVPQKVLVPSQ